MPTLSASPAENHDSLIGVVSGLVDLCGLTVGADGCFPPLGSMVDVEGSFCVRVNAAAFRSGAPRGLLVTFEREAA